MRQVLKRPEAETDLEEIWLFIAQDNVDKADMVLISLRSAANRSRNSRAWA